VGRIHDALQRAERERERRARDLAGILDEVPEERVAEAAPAAPPTAQARDASLRISDVAPPAPSREHARPVAPPALDGAAFRASSLRSADLEGSISDQYKSLRARLQSLRRQRELRSLVVTSAKPGEGKTTTAFHLAQSYGLDSGFDTCLIDLDLRTASLGSYLASPPPRGIAEILDGTARLDDGLVQIPGTRLFVIPAGKPPANPAELLESVRMRQLVDALHARFGLVIIDSPPVLGLPDDTVIVDLFDAVLLVVGRETTTPREISAVLERIDRTKLIGTVLNRSEPIADQYTYGYYARSAPART
jgi:capsular exopolysaccharide synthesis family protein